MLQKCRKFIRTAVAASVPLGLVAIMAVAGIGLMSAKDVAQTGPDSGRGPDYDGVLSSQERSKASVALERNPTARDLIAQQMGRVTEWQPAELEGEARGAVAYIEFPSPVSIAPPVVRPVTPTDHPDQASPQQAAEVALRRVEDYNLETVTLVGEVVERYIAIVDIPSGQLVIFAPSPRGPKINDVPPKVKAKSNSRGPAPAVPITMGATDEQD